jgi:predicted NUDIX family NTP pyrophosphohydrolase
MDLELKRPPGPLFRVGRDDDAWAIPDWAYAKEDRTFGNRFDDPAGVYRVLYASSQRLGCFIETLVTGDN